MIRILVCLFIFAISFSAVSEPMKNPYKFLSCSVRAGGETLADLNGRWIDGLDKVHGLEKTLFINENVAGFGQVNVVQPEFQPNKLTISLTTSDLLGIHVNGAMSVVETDIGLTGYFQFNSNVHELIFIDCIMSKSFE